MTRKARAPKPALKVEVFLVPHGIEADFFNQKGNKIGGTIKPFDKFQDPSSMIPFLIHELGSAMEKLEKRYDQAHKKV